MSAQLAEQTETERNGVGEPVELLRARIAIELRRVGVRLPDAMLDDVAEVVLADAVQIALAWLGEA